ncbi:MAG: IS30 family transposase [Rickettsiales bacterium]|nr:IS30 family transposase [Rickettsiales bacterium]
MERTYRHLIKSERDEIYRLLTGGISHREIARRLGRSASTISREIKRNKQPLGYLPDTAQDVASKRRRRGYFKIDRYPVLKSALLEGLAKRWSPEQIAAFCYGKMTFCHETIYRYIYHSPWAIKFDLSAFLWREKPRRTKRRWRKSRSKIKDRISIHTRSKHIENRTHYNHWEADLMLFKSRKNNLITAVERKSRYLLIVNNPDGKKAKPVAERLSDAIAPFNPKSITLDNGLEFANHKDLPAKTYFCDPYSSWQKGSVENANGLIRKFLPKSYDGPITQEMLENIQHLINNRPRKILGWKTPAEIFNRCTSN